MTVDLKKKLSTARPKPSSQAVEWINLYLSEYNIITDVEY